MTAYTTKESTYTRPKLVSWSSEGNEIEALYVNGEKIPKKEVEQ